MSKWMLVGLVVGLAAVIVLPALGDGVVVVVNGQQVSPQGNPAPGGSVVVGERGEWVKTAAYVPAVPTPPGVLSQYAPLPCAVPYAPRVGGDPGAYYVQELGENDRD